MVPFYEFMLISQKNQTSTSTYLDFIKSCADGGITSLQLREKSLSFEELVDLGLLLKEVLDPYKIPLVINDFSKLTEFLNTPYIHLGQKDGVAESILREHPLAQIGVSIDTIENIHHTNTIPSLSYVTASAVFPSSNKNNINTIWGLEGLRELSYISKHPLTAIGGITIDNCLDVLQHGAKGIALIGAIHDAENPYKTCKSFKNILDSYLR